MLFLIRYINYIIISNGGYSWSNINGSSGVRPVLSLKYGVESTIGDGSMENPYIVNN